MKAFKKILFFNMLIVTAPISMQTSSSAVPAKTALDGLVSIVQDVCVAPTSPEAMLAAGETAAAAGNWKLVRSGSAPMPMLHNENGTKISYETAWQVGLPDGSLATLYVSILRPDWPGVKYDICLLQPATDVDAGDLARAINIHFGPALTKDTSGKGEQERWFFTEEKPRGNCGKQLSFFLNQTFNRGKPKALLFYDFVFPEDSQWRPLADATTRCPN